MSRDSVETGAPASPQGSKGYSNISIRFLNALLTIALGLYEQISSYVYKLMGECL